MSSLKQLLDFIQVKQPAKEKNEFHLKGDPDYSMSKSEALDATREQDIRFFTRLL